MSTTQDFAGQVRGSVTPRTVIGPFVPTIAPRVAAAVLTAMPGRQPAARASPSNAPVPIPASRPLSGPNPEMRFSSSSSSPGIGTCAFSDSVSTVFSGVLLDGRPRTAMSM